MRPKSNMSTPLQVFAGLFVGVVILSACSPAPKAVDLIFSSGLVYTMNPQSPVAEAVAIRDGKIVAGNVRLEHTEALAPFRPYTSAMFSVTTYAKRLTLALHYDSSALQEHQASDLHKRFVQKIGDSMR